MNDSNHTDERLEVVEAAAQMAQGADAIAADLLGYAKEARAQGTSVVFGPEDVEMMSGCIYLLTRAFRTTFESSLNSFDLSSEFSSAVNEMMDEGEGQSDE